MKGSLGAALFALLFAVPFGGVGVFASWMIWNSVSTHWKSGDWVVVQAKVQSSELVISRGSKGGSTYAAKGTYTYAFGGRQYTSDRLGLDNSGGSDNVGEWHHDMAAYLKEAQEAGRTIPVHVNPEDPQEAVVDRDMRWGMLLFMSIFAIAFGGVGVGALVVFLSMLFGPLIARMKGIDLGAGGRSAGPPDSLPTLLARQQPTTQAGPIRSDGAGGLVFFWLFAIIWNGISVPAAMLAVPKAWNDGEWMLFLVLLFPLVGALVVWGAIAQTVGRLRFGRGTLTLARTPRMGAALEGYAEFPRGLKVGQPFKVKLQSLRSSRSPGKSVSGEAWSFETDATAVAGPKRPRIPIRFDVPPESELPLADPGVEVTDTWHVEVHGPASVVFTFAIPMESKPVAAKPRFAGQELATSSALPF